MNHSTENNPVVSLNGERFNTLSLVGIVCAVVGIASTAVFALKNHDQFYFSYLVSFLFWLSIALGGLFFVLVQFATKAGWSVVVRRFAEVWMNTLPLFVVLFIPVGLGLHGLFHWSHHEAIAEDPILQAKASYLNAPFFYIRAAFYLLIWTLLARIYFKKSTEQDVTGNPDITRFLQKISYPGIAVFAVTVTFAAFDWIMSLNPHWFSTIFGVYLFSGCVIAICANVILLVVAARRLGLTSISVEHLQDIGKLLFAFIVFWSYIAFSQYMLIWYANLPEETVFFVARWQGSWRYVSIALGIGHFVIPFFFLMSRHMKRKTPTLVIASLWMLAMHALDLYWLVMPTFHVTTAKFHLLDVTTFLAVGGVCLFWVARTLQKYHVVPVRDPRLAESLAFENY